MNWLDWVVVLVVGLGVIRGLRRGFVRSLLGLVGLIAAVVLGWSWSPQLVQMMESRWAWQTRIAEHLVDSPISPQAVGGVLSPAADYTDMAHMLLTVFAFAIVFMVVRATVALLSSGLHLAVGWGVTGILNSVMGGLFGFFTATIALAVILGVLLTASTAFPLLEGIAEAVEASAMSRELVRIFYRMSPLRDHLLEHITLGGVRHAVPAVLGGFNSGS